MPDAASQPPFRPLAQKLPDIECIRKADGTVYLTQRHKPGDRPRSIPHALATRAGIHPDRDWLKQRNPETDDWEAITYGEGLRRTRALAQAFLDMGAGPDAPVMILSGNSIESALVMVAAMTIGAPAAPISVPYSLMSTDFAKLKHCFGAVQPKVLFASQLKPFEPAIGALGDHGCTVVTADGANGAVSYHGLLDTAV
ncbi:MAG: AMP-binding protein, partial [Pseudomonadota bacterium]|nr:AMP-binding protein [Pseudomonadota bacterium]